LRPLRKLRSEGKCRIALVEEGEIESWRPPDRPRRIAKLWKTFRPTLVIFSRYAGGDYELLVDAARSHNTPIVAHLDDDLFDVPAVLGQRKRDFHNSPERLASLGDVFRSADLIYVPTEPLAECIRQRGFRAPVVVPPIQVAADPEELRPPRQNNGGPITVGYMGTASHQDDLGMIAPPLARLLEENEDLRFETFGTIAMPSELARFGDRVRAIPAEKDYSMFLERLGRLKWDLGLAPLRETEFNNLRTYTKWLEYTLAGICVVASNIPVYRTVVGDSAGVLTEATEWYASLRRLMDFPASRSLCVEMARRQVTEHHASTRLAEQIVHLESTTTAGVAIRSTDE
jgi:glycosyltransferase involved in cell wall biosynthesis